MFVRQQSNEIDLVSQQIEFFYKNAYESNLPVLFKAADLSAVESQNDSNIMTEWPISSMSVKQILKASFFSLFRFLDHDCEKNKILKSLDLFRRLFGQSDHHVRHMFVRFEFGSR